MVLEDHLGLKPKVTVIGAFRLFYIISWFSHLSLSNNHKITYKILICHMILMFKISCVAEFF